MRQRYSEFRNIEQKEKSDNSDITDLTATVELEALNSTLDKLQLEISVNQQMGAVYSNISEKVIVTNLKDLVYKNEKGLYEIKLDPENLLMLGSLNSVKD